MGGSNNNPDLNKYLILDVLWGCLDKLRFDIPISARILLLLFLIKILLKAQDWLVRESLYDYYDVLRLCDILNKQKLCFGIFNYLFQTTRKCMCIIKVHIHSMI